MKALIPRMWRTVYQTTMQQLNFATLQGPQKQDGRPIAETAA